MSFIYLCLSVGIVGLAWVTVAGANEEPAGVRPTAAKSVAVYFGTYTVRKSQGIYVSTLEPMTGELSRPILAAEMSDPSYLAISADRRFLYAVGESKNVVAAFAIGADRKLTLLNEQPSGGVGPCDVTVDQTGKTVAVANYASGSIASYRVGPDGRLSAPVTIDQHPQPKPHAHCVEVDPTDRFALCCDLGLNKIYVYRLDSQKGSLSPNDPASVSLTPGSGPRHLAFSQNQKFVYSINETASTMTAFTWDPERGVLQEIQTLSTLPAEGFKGRTSTAEVVMHPSGKFLYGSNRGHDSIVAFRVDETTGKLTLVGHTPTPGKTPRGFGIDLSGQWLITGSQDSDAVHEFKINPQTGELKLTDLTYELGSPVCVKFVESAQ